MQSSPASPCPTPRGDQLVTNVPPAIGPARSTGPILTISELTFRYCKVISFHAWGMPYFCDGERSNCKWIDYSPTRRKEGGEEAMRKLWISLPTVGALWLVSAGAFAQSLVYSHQFDNRVSYLPGSAQFDDWLSFRASLLASGVTSITVSGSLDPAGRTCGDGGPHA